MKVIHPDEAVEEIHPDEMKRKTEGRSNKAVEEATADRISCLPDNLLYDILSFLPYEKVMATAALSRRWRTICETAPDLCFVQSVSSPWNPAVEDRAFIDSVDSALRRRSRAVPVRSFALTTRSKIYDETKLSSWIRYATDSSMLQSLDLSLYQASPSSFEVPSSFFRLPLLRALRLHCRASCLRIDWPATASLPSLEKLDLAQVLFVPMAKDAISNSCPVLKNWNMIFHSETPELEVKSPLLEFLTLEKLGDPLASLCICGPNIRTVKVVQEKSGGLGPTRFNLSTPGLETLVWLGPPPSSATIDSVPASLVSTFLIPIFRREFYVDLLYNGSLSTTFTVLHVNRLVVLETSMEILSKFVFDQRDQPNAPTPNYGNLEHLEIFGDFGEFDSLGVAFLLKNSSNLKTLLVSFPIGLEMNANYAKYFEAKGGFGRGGYWDSYGFSLEQLVEISFNRFLGVRWEYDFLEFLLRVATSLKKMTISIASYPVNMIYNPMMSYPEMLQILCKHRRQILQMIKQLQQASPHIKISVL